MIYWHRYGKGSRLIVGLHGWNGDHRTFEPLARLLPERFSLLACDQPGFGGSPSVERWTLDSVAAPLIEDLREQPKFRLIGSCSGAVVALRIAVALAPKVERLILVDPFLYAPWYFRLFTWPLLGSLFYHSTFANPLGRWLTQRALAKRRAEGSDLTGGFARVDHGVALGYLGALVRARFTDEAALRSLADRVVLVHGERTFAAVRRSITDWRQRYWPGAAVVEALGAGHLPIQEATETVARILYEG